MVKNKMKDNVKSIPIRNLIWFPSAKLSLLVITTIIIEAGIIGIFCVFSSFTQEQTSAIVSLVVAVNLLTGLIGWAVASWKWWNL